MKRETLIKLMNEYRRKYLALLFWAEKFEDGQRDFVLHLLDWLEVIIECEYREFLSDDFMDWFCDEIFKAEKSDEELVDILLKAVEKGKEKNES